MDVLVQMKVGEMNRKTIQSLCKFLADVCGIQYHQLAWLGYKEGHNDTVILMTVLPSSCLSRLRERLKVKGDTTLKQMAILDVETVQGNRSAINRDKEEILIVYM